MVQSEKMTLSELFKSYEQIYNKDHTLELQESAAGLAEYTDLTQSQIATMNLTCDEIDALTIEARYRYQERANILKQVEIAKKMHDIKTNKAVEEQGFSVESFIT